MGKLSQATKDRKCIFCSESRLRTANELKAHSVKCLAALRVHINGGGTMEDYTPPKEIR